MIPATYFTVRVNGRGNRQVWIGPHPSLNTATTTHADATRFGQPSAAYDAAAGLDQDTTVERCTLTVEDLP